MTTAPTHPREQLNRDPGELRLTIAGHDSPTGQPVDISQPALVWFAHVVLAHLRGPDPAIAGAWERAVANGEIGKADP